MSSSSKRPCEEVIANCKTLIFDVEGTTTSISFVKDTLFPFVRSNLEAYVKKQWSSEEFKTDLALLREQAVKDAADKVEGCVAIPEEGSDDDLQAAVVGNVLWQMDADRKTKALKQLQGHVMREGYEQGQLKGHLYPDVVPAMRAWVENGLKLYIYSSGSVEAQKMLFGHSEQGDLLEMIQGHFDTEVGSKQDVTSYTSIGKLVECSPSEVVFFTDVPAEAKAAEGAGMTAVLVEREGNAPLSEDDRTLYQVIGSFDAFLPESPLKRRKVSADAEVLSTDVEMSDVSEAPTAPVTPTILDKPVEKEVRADDRAECETPTLDERQDVSEGKDSQTKDIVQSESNEMEAETTKPEEDIPKRVTESELENMEQIPSAETTKPEEDIPKRVTESELENMEQTTSAETTKPEEDIPKKVTESELENMEQISSEHVEPETKIELTTLGEKTELTELPPKTDANPTEPEASTGEKVEEPQTVLSNDVESPVAPVEKANPENTLVEEEKLTKMETAIEKADEAKAPEDVAVVKEAPSHEEETKEKAEEMKPEASIEKPDIAATEDTLKLTESSVGNKNSEEEKNGIAEVNETENVNTVGSEASEKMETIEKLEPEKEMLSAETKEETDSTCEKTDLVDVKTVNDKEELAKTNGAVEMGQGDGGTLVELSKNVDNAKDSVEEIKVKKILDDNAADDTENAVPVTLET